MRHRSFLLLLVAGLLVTGFSVGVSQGAGTNSIDTDQERLHTALLPTDNLGLLNFLRLRARGEPSRETLSQLIEALHSPTLTVCQQACAELVTIGTPALPPLRVTARGPDGPATAWARRCLKAIEADGGTLAVAAARLLAQRRPPGTASVLLDYLPHAENESVLQEFQDALNAVAYDEKGVADPAVVKVLSDKHPLRRAAAVVALTEGDFSRYLDELHKLLLDPAPPVRLRAALALAQADDPQAVSVLIDLLGELADPETGEMIEDFLAGLAGELGPKVGLGDDETPRRKARDAWATWWRGTEGTNLLDELKKRTISDADLDRMRALIQKLGDDNFQVRQETEADLIRLGVPVRPLLKRALKDPDLEVRRRAQRCLASIEVTKEEFFVQLPVIARLIALRKPAGAAEAILAYLPSLDDDGLIEELQHALNAVAFSGGRPQPALLKGLTDRWGLRRAAAAGALCAGRRTDHVEAVRKLLNDAEPVVRLKAALALAGARDAVAVPALISLVGELPAEQMLQAEAYLNRLAGQGGPKDLPDGEENGKKRSKLWSTWWEVNKSRVVLIDPFGPAMRELSAPTRGGSLRGYTLLIQLQTNTVTELGRDDKPRWTLTGLLHPCDAQVLPGGQRVLVVEQHRVTERDLRGKILWQKEVPNPRNAQRLRNGNTFITCQNQLLEVNRAGKEVLKVAFDWGIAAARQLPNGQIIAFGAPRRRRARNQVIKLDRTGRELKSILVHCGGGGCNEVLDNGHVLVLSPGFGNIIEFDIDGNEVGRFNIPGAAHGFRLPNGHTLVTIEGGKVVELDKKWMPIKETPLTTPAFRVKRR